MSDGVLSQEEIDALLRSNTFQQETSDETPPGTGSASAGAVMDSSGAAIGDLNAVEKDAVGEVANIVMGSAATALSTLLGKKVEITAPTVQLTDPESFRQEYPLPYLLVNVEYIVGLTGSNVLIIRDRDACVMVDLMMGGDGQSPPTVLDDMYLSAISEAMNQMMGSASTAMSTIIQDRVEISPPVVRAVNFATDEIGGVVGQKGQMLAKVAFRIIIEDLVDSEIMQLIPLDLARNMVKSLMNQMSGPDMSGTGYLPEDSFAIPELSQFGEPMAPPPPDVNPAPQVAAAAEPMAMQPPITNMYQNPGIVQTVPAARTTPVSSSVPVQPVQFAPLQAGYQPKEIANIELIMDVPLQISVELGKSRKTIREILGLGPGSVVELDKLAGEPVDLLVNGKLLAKGEVVVIDENFGIRITDIISPIERVANLQ